MIFSPMSPRDYVRFLRMIEDGVISHHAAKRVFDILWDEGLTAFRLELERRGWVFDGRKWVPPLGLL